MRLHLAEAVHAVMIDEDLVFLHVDRDAYSCLPLPPGLAKLETGDLVTDDPTLAQALIAAGLASPSTKALTRLPPPALPSRSAGRLIAARRQRSERLTLLRLRAVLVAVASALVQHRKTLRQRLSPPSALDQDHDLPRLLADLAVWRRLSPWLPLDGACLFPSALLRAYLRDLGHDPHWVFGVRTWPFRAHCWLQAGDIALDDEAERLCAYAPIMAA